MKSGGKKRPPTRSNPIAGPKSRESSTNAFQRPPVSTTKRKGALPDDLADAAEAALDDLVSRASPIPGSLLGRKTPVPPPLMPPDEDDDLEESRTESRAQSSVMEMLAEEEDDELDLASTGSGRRYTGTSGGAIGKGRMSQVQPPGMTEQIPTVALADLPGERSEPTSDERPSAKMRPAPAFEEVTSRALPSGRASPVASGRASPIPTSTTTGGSSGASGRASPGPTTGGSGAGRVSAGSTSTTTGGSSGASGRASPIPTSTTTGGSSGASGRASPIPTGRASPLPANVIARPAANTPTGPTGRASPVPASIVPGRSGTATPTLPTTSPARIGTATPTLPTTPAPGRASLETPTLPTTSPPGRAGLETPTLPTASPLGRLTLETPTNPTTPPAGRGGIGSSTSPGTSPPGRGGIGSSTSPGTSPPGRGGIGSSTSSTTSPPARVNLETPTRPAATSAPRTNLETPTRPAAATAPRTNLETPTVPTSTPLARIKLQPATAKDRAAPATSANVVPRPAGWDRDTDAETGGTAPPPGWDADTDDAESIGAALAYAEPSEERVVAELPPLRFGVYEDATNLASAQGAIVAAGHVVALGASGRDGMTRVLAAVRGSTHALDAIIVALPGGEPIIDAALAFEPRRPIIIASVTGKSVDGVQKAIASGADLVTMRPHDVERFAPLLLAVNRIEAERRTTLLARGTEQMLRAKIEELSDPDPRGLQALPMFQHTLELEIKRAKRFEYPLSVLLFAVDIPPPAPPPGILGILRARAGNALINSIRDIDIATQVDLERFLVLLPYTDLKGGANLARRIIAAVAKGDPVVSAGRTFYPRFVGAVAGAKPGEAVSFAKLMKDATQALDGARRDGAELAVQP